LEVRGPSSTARLRYPVNGKVSTGGSEDGQVFIPLADLQAALGIPGKISLAELRIEGSTDQIEEVARQLSANFPLLEVRPVREIVYSEGQVLETVRWALLSLTLVVVIITVLCLLATVTAIVLERRREIGLMKALGAADGQLMAFFLTEVAILASVGGLAGFGVGGVLAKLLGIRLFGVPLDLHWPSLPGVLLATLAVSLLGAWPPIRVVRRIRPAWVLKGE
jgi:putative ABC transport system permease protein